MSPTTIAPLAATCSSVCHPDIEFSVHLKFSSRHILMAPLFAPDADQFLPDSNQPNNVALRRCPSNRFVTTLGFRRSASWVASSDISWRLHGLIFPDMCILYIYIYMSHRKNPGNTKYVLGGLVYGNWWKLLKTHGKRWDLPKFVDVLSVNLGFSRLLI